MELLWGVYTLIRKVDATSYGDIRSAIRFHLRERYGELTSIGSSLYQSEDGNEFLIAYGKRSEKRRNTWLALRHNAVEQLAHPQGFFAFAVVDEEEGKIFFFEVPMQELAERIEEAGMKPGLQGDRYSLVVKRRQGRFRIRRIDLDIQEYLITETAIATEQPRTVSSGQDEEETQTLSPTYTAEEFLSETYLTQEKLAALNALLEEKQQIVLYGPPGTGKTYVAQKFARYFVWGEEDRIQIVQFHPSYSYEEFIEGIRPEARDEGPPRYPVRPGIFREFCEEARGQEGRFVMIIDEINRGNIAKIFGELMFLLEYRDSYVPLAYSGRHFSIPRNVYLIGTMNTADRSIALVDFALRRRFHFIQFSADRAILERWLENNDVDALHVLDLFDAVNRAIDDPDYQIGFSYFMRRGMTQADLRRVWRYSIEPYLEEYFFDNPAKVEELRWEAVMTRFQADE